MQFLCVAPAPRAPGLVLMLSVPTVLTCLLGAAHAAGTTDHLSAASDALRDWDYKTATAELDAARDAALQEPRPVPPELLGRIWLYRAAVAYLSGEGVDRAMDEWRQALVVAPDLPWEDGIVADDRALGIYEALRDEVRDGDRTSAGVPDKVGAARLYLDGVQRHAGDTVPTGLHLAQVACPDGEYVGRWTPKPHKLKWLKLCPGGVDTSAVVTAGEDDVLDEMGPTFGAAESDSPPADAAVASVMGAPAQALLQAVGEAETAFSRADLDGFNAAQEKAKAALEAQEHPLRPSDAAALHRLEGMAAFIDKDRGRTLQALRAARAIDRDFELSEDVAPKGHPLHDIWVAAGRSMVTEVSVVPSPGGQRVMLDGSYTTNRPRNRAIVAQLVDDEGRAVLNAYLWPEDPWPVSVEPDAVAVAAIPGASPQGDLAQVAPLTPRGPDFGRAVPLAVGTGVAAVATAALTAWGTSLHARYDDRDNPELSGDADEDRAYLSDLRTRTNTVWFTTLGTGALTAGLGVAAVMAVEW